mmetsp:Transcript_13824/g.39814  ORF Transcript_13824/g.39814 Transcript_13824/m.39814 type:complete len:297 (-) Transcript_13824:22-912(-)
MMTLWLHSAASRALPTRNGPWPSLHTRNTMLSLLSFQAHSVGKAMFLNLISPPSTIRTSTSIDKGTGVDAPSRSVAVADLSPEASHAECTFRPSEESTSKRKANLPGSSCRTSIVRRSSGSFHLRASIVSPSLSLEASGAVAVGLPAEASSVGEFKLSSLPLLPSSPCELLGSPVRSSMSSVSSPSLVWNGESASSLRASLSALREVGEPAFFLPTMASSALNCFREGKNTDFGAREEAVFVLPAVASALSAMGGSAFFLATKNSAFGEVREAAFFPPTAASALSEVGESDLFPAT